MSEGERTKRLIPPEHEYWFREDFTYFWEQGYTAKQIYEEMQFGKNDMGEAPWEGLKLYHVYYFADKYGLKKRHTQRKSRVC